MKFVNVAKRLPIHLLRFPSSIHPVTPPLRSVAPPRPATDEAAPSGCRCINHYPPPMVPTLDGASSNPLGSIFGHPPCRHQQDRIVPFTTMLRHVVPSVQSTTVAKIASLYSILNHRINTHGDHAPPCRALDVVRHVAKIASLYLIANFRPCSTKSLHLFMSRRTTTPTSLTAHPPPCLRRCSAALPPPTPPT